MSTLSNKTKSGNIVFPNTEDDMVAMEEWTYGDKLYGSFAKSIGAFKRYREDIIRAYGREKDYDKNVIYVDTLKPIGPQLDKFK